MTMEKKTLRIMPISTAERKSRLMLMMRNRRGKAESKSNFSEKGAKKSHKKPVSFFNTRHNVATQNVHGLLLDGQPPK